MDRLVARFKYGGDLVAGDALARLLADAASTMPRPDLIVPVPLHRTRLRERGFDQAWEIARITARELHLPAQPRLLERTRHTPAQAGLTAEQRRRNLRNAFIASDTARGLHIALIDDVSTTGTTLRAATRALLRAGTKAVQVWTVARAAPPS